MQDEFVTIGTPIISNNVFRKILRPMNNFSFKPSGGLWASRSSNFGVCSWLDYLAETESRPHIYYTRNLTTGASFTLKKSANILMLDTYDDFIKITMKYPSIHHKLNYYKEIDAKHISLDYEELSKIYDGIYVNYYELKLSGKTDVFNDWSCNTLLLFNLDCIEEYRTLDIAYDIDLRDDYPVLKSSSSPKKIIDKSSEFIMLYNYFNETLKEMMPKNTLFEDYDKYLEVLLDCINKNISFIQNNKLELIKPLENVIYFEGIKLSREDIVRNIGLNSLRNYLDNDKGRILTLKKSTISNKKWYKI